MNPQWVLVAIAALGMIGSWVTIAFYAGRIAGRIDALQREGQVRHDANLERFRGVDDRLGGIESAIRHSGMTRREREH